jgi:hypothetical protein
VHGVAAPRSWVSACRTTSHTWAAAVGNRSLIVMGRSLSGRRSTVLKIGDSHPDVRAAAASLAVMAAGTGFGDRGRRRRVGAPVQPLEPGILHPSAAARRFAYERHVPDVRLQPYVENFWTITWDLRGQDPYVAQVLPYPSVNASVTSEQADVTGVQRRRYERRLTGLGYVVGAPQERPEARDASGRSCGAPSPTSPTGPVRSPRCWAATPVGCSRRWRRPRTGSGG